MKKTGTSPYLPWHRDQQQGNLPKVGTNQDIEIASETGRTMKGHSVSTNNQVLNATSVQQRAEIYKVLLDIHLAALPGGWSDTRF